VIEATYCSEQPLIDSGYIGDTGLFYLLSSVNGVEIVDIENAQLFTKVTRYPHNVDYVISLQTIKQGGVWKLFLHCGNNKGEVFIYDLDYKKKQVVSKEGEVKEDNLTLVDMIQVCADQS